MVSIFPQPISRHSMMSPVWLVEAILLVDVSNWLLLSRSLQFLEHPMLAFFCLLFSSWVKESKNQGHMPTLSLHWPSPKPRLHSRCPRLWNLISSYYSHSQEPATTASNTKQKWLAFVARLGCMLEPSGKCPVGKAKGSLLSCSPTVPTSLKKWMN